MKEATEKTDSNEKDCSLDSLKFQTFLDDKSNNLQYGYGMTKKKNHREMHVMRRDKVLCNNRMVALHLISMISKLMNPKWRLKCWTPFFNSFEVANHDC